MGLCGISRAIGSMSSPKGSRFNQQKYGFKQHTVQLTTPRKSSAKIRMDSKQTPVSTSKNCENVTYKLQETGRQPAQIYGVYSTS